MTDKQQPKEGHAHTMHEREKQKKWSFTPSAMVLIVGLAVIVGFAAGSRSDQIIAAIAPTLGFRVETGKLDLSSVQNTYQQLSTNFNGKLDSQALIDGASKGLVAAAGDIHTEYFTGKEAEKFDNDLNGTIGGGIGAQIGMREDKPTVIGVLKGSPAEKEGIAAGDIILSVNDESVEKKTVDQTVQKIRGEVGTTVKLAVLREDEPKEFTITREEIVSPSVTSKIEGDTGIMTVAMFNKDTGEQALAAAQEFKNKGVKKVILDLRDNGGGTLEAAPELAGLWLDDKVIVSERRDGKVEGEQRSGSNALLAGIPTIVLVNGGTASASEIVTAAFKEHNVATVIGEKTYGKGTVQTVIRLNNGAMLKVTVQRWFTPNGKNIDGKGLTPDQEVKLTKDDVNANRDPQLDAARQRLDK